MKGKADLVKLRVLEEHNESYDVQAQTLYHLVTMLCIWHF